MQLKRQKLTDFANLMSQVVVLEKSVPEGIAVYCSHQFHSNTELEQNKRIQQTAKNGRRRVCAPHA